MGDQGEQYTGNIKARRPLKGGGSVSGKLWNNRQAPLEGKTPSGNQMKAGRYSGNAKQGPRSMGDQGEEYTGNIKARRPIKGGGSVSGKLWNNQQTPLEGKTPSGNQMKAGRYSGNAKQGPRSMGDQGEEYTGNIKARRPIKGGGSVSGKLWNNMQSPLEGKTPSGNQMKAGRYSGNIKQGGRVMGDQGEEYAGNIKARRPLKGGGSVSGKLWNNRQAPLEGKTPSGNQMKAGRFSGNMKQSPTVMGDQGEEYAGSLKTRRPAKGGGSVSGKLWNNKEKPIENNPPTESTRKSGSYTGNLRTSRFKKDYVKNPHSDEEAIKVIRPSSGHLRASKSSGSEMDNAPYMVDQGEEFTGFIKHPRFKKPYIKNPNASKESIRVARAGKAYGRSVDFQGNIKMKKFEIFGKPDRHPDAQFVKQNKNNVKEERSLLTNVKLVWSRLFRKNETQPDNVKEKERRPRYDKREVGLWYD